MRRSCCCLLLLFWLGGCGSHALLQTAHTTPPASVRASAGATMVLNALTNDSSRHPLMTMSPEAGVRVGLTRSLDVGASPFFRRGLSVDGKMNVRPPEDALALAPRLRLGYALPDEESSVALAEAGVIVSHRWLGALEPYAALAFANHWIRSPVPEWDLADNQSLAESSGTGDGVLKAQLGLDLSIVGGFGVLVEYGYWKPLQNDPGDGFQFIDDHVVALALRFEGGGSRSAQRDRSSRSTPSAAPEGAELSRFSM